MSWYYLFGIAAIDADLGAGKTKSDAYNTAAGGFGNAYSTVSDAVALVMANNEGSGAEAFQDTMTSGYGATVPGLERLNTAALETAKAYLAASNAIESAKVAMDAVVWDVGGQMFDATTSFQFMEAANLYEQGRSKLLTLENAAVSNVTSAFEGVDLPQRLSELGPRDNGLGWGNLDDGIAEKWATMTDEERLATLQAIADEYADANGIPRITLQLAVLEYKTVGRYEDGEVFINIDRLDDPKAIGITVHEMEHSAQFYGMDPAGGGMTPEEAQRWRELHEPHVRDKGGPTEDHRYNPRPIEVGGREAGRNFIDNLTYEEFLDYV